jgi:hypothetical protein
METTMRLPIRFLRPWVALAGGVLLAGCASLPGGMPTGTTIEQARNGFMKPTAEYTFSNGFTRLEFNQGKQTFMLDFDPSGKLADTQQVLTEDYFATIKPGQTEEWVHERIGTPVRIFPIGWQNAHVLNYRFAEGNCVWFQVTISNETRQVTDAGTGQDPACDVGSSKD